MTAQTFESAWQAYQVALRELYRTSKPSGEGERGVSAQASIQIPVAGGEFAVAERSVEVRQVLETAMQEPKNAELAGLKLIAAAAHDFSLANELMQLEPGGKTGAELERSARRVVMTSPELQAVLDVTFQDGMHGLAEVEREALPVDTPGALAKLQETITQFEKDIPAQAAALGIKAVAGVVNLGLGPAQGAASLAAQEILAHLPQGVSEIVKRAAGLVGEGINKLRSAWNPTDEQKALAEAADWLNKLKGNEAMAASILNVIYETPKIKDEVAEELDNKKDRPAARLNPATRALQEKLATYGKTKATLEVMLSVLAFIKTPLLAALPWGPLAVYSAYLSVLGYAVYSGGDYLDWNRTGNMEWLDRVKGLRKTVKEI